MLFFTKVSRIIDWFPCFSTYCISKFGYLLSGEYPWENANISRTKLKNKIPRHLILANKITAQCNSAIPVQSKMISILVD